MNNRNLIYLIISLLFLIPTTSFSFGIGDGEFPIAETDTTNFQLFSFYDLRARDSFVQVTNTGGQATLHVQVFDVSNLCNENNFFDTYTPNDTHIYDMRNIQTNNGNPSGVVMADGAYGFVVVTVVQGNGQPADPSGVIIGNFRVIDNAGYEYRTNSHGFNEGDPIGGKYFINYTTAGGINKSDIVGITVKELLSGEVKVAGTSVTFDTSIFNNNEVIFSCSDTTFSCTENTFEYGINNAIPHSRDKALLCGSNNVPEGFVKLVAIPDRISETEAFGGFAGINTGDNSRGSMDSLISVRTISCGDSILDTGSGETCDPPGDPQAPNDNECRFDCTFCGDGIVNGGEDCDDGNTDDTDECNNDCELQGGCCLEQTEAICFEELITETDCTMLSTTGVNGVYLGDGTMCDTTTNCQSPPTGACCDNFDCQVLTAADCSIINTNGYQGDGTACEANICGIPPVP